MFQKKKKGLELVKHVIKMCHFHPEMFSLLSSLSTRHGKRPWNGTSIIITLDMLYIFLNHDIDNFFFPQKDGGKLAFAGVGTFPFELPYGGSSQGIGAAVAGFARGTLDAAKGWR